MVQKRERQYNFILIRHGQTLANQEHRYLGTSDEALSESGKEKLVEQKKQYANPDILCSSPMKRCLETAAILYPQKEPYIVDEWKEMDFGAFEGKNFQELKDDLRYQEWLDSNGTIAFPEGESREEFIERTVAGMDTLLSYIEEQQEAGTLLTTIGAVVHGGTIMALLSHFCDGEYFDYQVSNGEGYQCKLLWGEDGLKIVECKRI